MKQILLATTLLLIGASLSAQTDFKLKTTTFSGALSDDAASDWTKDWTNWDPKNTSYPAPTDLTTLNGMDAALPVPGEKNITGTLALDASKVYKLSGLVVVRSGGKLVIPAGTLIRASADLNSNPKNYASIIVERGGQIEVLGTESAPVVITSDNAAGSRDRGDWGGLVISGRAQHNLLNGTTNDNVQMEGFNNITFDATLARFGGSVPTDNSGIIRYLRLEFAGTALETNKEINALTLGGVGSATELHHVQVSFCNDDSFEWFGGNVNSSHLISFKTTDDDFDTDNGYAGISQFGIALRDTAYYDKTYGLPSGASTSEGFESDGEATGTAAVKPYTNAIFSNYTMVGPVPVGSKYSDLNSVTKAAFRRGARIRRNSSLRVVNSIFMGYRNFVMFDGDSSVRNTNWPAALALVTPNTAVAVTAKQASFNNNLIVSTAAAFTSTTDTTANGLVEVARATGSGKKLAALNEYVRQTGPLANCIDPVAFTAGTLLVNPVASSTSPDFRPVPGSPALSGCVNFLGNPVLANLVITPSVEIPVAQAQPVFPNPVSSDGTLQFGRQVASFGLFDLNGRLVKWGTDCQETSVDGLAAGVYFIKIDGRAQRVIVQ